jgi:uncharacterized zinc-type alcohol dehydrogenase-like protein
LSSDKNVRAYGTHHADEPLCEIPIERRHVQANDVEIDILYCGVCHSDLHTARNDWGVTKYPSIPGHEIVGRVISVGPNVNRHKVGDLVAVGCLVDSCRHCANCSADEEQYCQNGSTGTYNGADKYLGGHTYGGYSERIIVDEHFVLRVPANLDPAAVAPVLCAGITTWSPLRHWNISAGSKVGVIGLGGLGHMAIKLAVALGANTTLFTHSPGKAQDAIQLGAHAVILSTDEGAMEAAKNQFDLIIDTIPYAHDINPYVRTLATSGTLVLVGLIGELPEAVSTVPIVLGRRAVAGSLIGGIRETQELLDFCGQHDIVSDIELIAMEDINTAYERMLRSDVKYRFVINMATLKSRN